MALLRPNAEPAVTATVAGDIFLIDGAAGVRALAAANVAQLDGNDNLTLNNVIQGFASIPTAGGTTALTVTSAPTQYFTGTTTQTVTLPVTSTLELNHPFTIENASTGIITINSSGGNLVTEVGPGATATVKCIAITGTTAASWSTKFDAVLAAPGKVLTLSNSLTLAGTDGTVLTFPATSATIARTDAGQTFTGTQAFGALTATTLNGNTFTAGTGVLTIAAAKTLTANNSLTLAGVDGKTLTVSNSLALAGTDGTTQTFPSTSGTVVTSVSSNVVTNAMRAQMGAATLKGNVTVATANEADFTVQGLVNLAAPSSTLDFIPIYDHVSGTIKNVTPGAIASSAVAGVSSIGGISGVIGVGPGITINGSNIQDDPAMIGEIRQLLFNRVPTNFLAASGGTRSRTTFAALYAALVVSSAVTISNASPGVVTWTGNQLQNNDPVLLTTTGGLPTGLSTATKYYVKGLSGNTFNLSATPGGAAINTSSAGSGVQTATNAPWEGTVVGDGSTTFTIPDLNGIFLRGIDNGNGTDINRSFGASQLDAMQGHIHTTPNLPWAPSQFIVTAGSGTVSVDQTSTTALPIGSPVTDGTNGTPRTAAETRPANQTVLFVIRYQ
jgi:hypothetical protein